MRTASRALSLLLEWFLIAQMVALTAVVVYAVVSRKLGASLSWYDEIAAIQLAWITYYGAALAALRRKHIGFDGVLLSLPPSARGARHRGGRGADASASSRCWPGRAGACSWCWRG